MFTLDRRSFLASLAGSAIAGETLSAAPQAPPAMAGACWLDVAAPFIVVDPAQQLSTELLLTATCFPGVDGYKTSRYGTEYQILLFDASGKEIPLDNAGKLSIPAMRPTLLNMKELTGRDAFVGGAKVRVAPSAHQVARVGDLFSAGFVRWNLPGNFDNVHAHPAIPPQLAGHYNYSMPFPAMSEYHCAFALFNPNDDETYGTVRVVDCLGHAAVERKFSLRPHQTTLYTLADLKPAETAGEALAIRPLAETKLKEGGVVVVRNESAHVPYAYTIMKGRQGQSFTVEHPLHFSADTPMKPARATPYGPNRSFPAQSLIYTPMLFKGLKVGGVELESRVYFSSSHWVEEALWKMPFVTTGQGEVAWVSNRDDRFGERLHPAALADQGLVRLTEFQSCRIAAADLPLPDGFSGGFGAACIPKTSHSLNKIEVRAVNWGRVAFTHFRPGGVNAMSYRQADDRGSLASDYIVSGAHVMGPAGARKRDCLLAVMNIEFEANLTGTPLLQVFGPAGLAAEKRLGDFPPLACRHFLLSELFPGLESDAAHPFTVRMQANALMIVSALHLDYERRDIALEHGSDRHSTFQDIKC